MLRIVWGLDFSIGLGVFRSVWGLGLGWFRAVQHSLVVLLTDLIICWSLRGPFSGDLLVVLSSPDGDGPGRRSLARRLELRALHVRDDCLLQTGLVMRGEFLAVVA